jgi:hypothetical protein
VHAATVAAVGALGGLISWAIYHAISGRDDGLGIFIVSLGVLNQPAILSLRAAVAVEVVSIILTLFFVAVFRPLLRRSQGDVGKKPKRIGIRKATDSPLWDPEVDPPVMR